MEHSEGTIDSARGEHIYYQVWEPAAPPRAALLLVHGLAEHSGRYAGFAEYFTAAGFSVYALDHPGHGRSEGRRGHVRRFRDFTDTLDRFLAQVKRSTGELPVILVGHSMGGLIAAAFLLERQAALHATVLSGPAIQAPEQPSRFAMFIMRLLSRIVPRLGVMQIEATGVSRDPEVVSNYVGDPLVFRGKVTARLAAELFGAMDAVLANAATIRLPLLILHGGEDSLTSVAGSRLLCERVSSEDKKLVVYDGLFHEIFNEPEKIEVMSEMKDWIEARLPQQARGRSA